MRTTLYGYIEEMQFWNDPVQSRVRKHNQRVIKSLPQADHWPPLSREMFAISSNALWPEQGPSFEYGGRIIHFGANLKGVEHEWKEWKEKFEQLLAKLIWLNAKVHFQTEYSKLATFEWTVDLFKYKVRKDGSMPPSVSPEQWVFENDPQG